MVQQLITGLKGSGGVKKPVGLKLNGTGSPFGGGKGFDEVLKGMLRGQQDKALSGARIPKEGALNRVKGETTTAVKTDESPKTRIRKEDKPETAEMAAALLKGSEKNRPVPEAETVRDAAGTPRTNETDAVKNRQEKIVRAETEKSTRETQALQASVVKRDESPAVKGREDADRDLKFTVEDRRSPFAKQSDGSREKNSSGHRDRKGEGSGFRETDPNREPRFTEAAFSVKDVQDSKDAPEVAGASRSRSAELLDRYLKVRGNEEIAKNIHFVVKDTGMGEIQMTLQPATLGKVRINLRLEENRIVGHVIVDSNQVREIFLDNIQAISKMLEEQGYGQTSLDVSVDQRQMEQNAGRGEGGKSYEQKYSERLKTAGEPEPVRYRAPTSHGRLDLIA
jgi:flagellar hook-length control protein FliK